MWTKILTVDGLRSLEVDPVELLLNEERLSLLERLVIGDGGFDGCAQVLVDVRGIGGIALPRPVKGLFARLMNG